MCLSEYWGIDTENTELRRDTPETNLGRRDLGPGERWHLLQGCRSFWCRNALRNSVTSVLSTSLGIFKPCLATLLLGGK